MYKVAIVGAGVWANNHMTGWRAREDAEVDVLPKERELEYVVQQMYKSGHRYRQFQREEKRECREQYCTQPEPADQREQRSAHRDSDDDETRKRYGVQERLLDRERSSA